METTRKLIASHTGLRGIAALLVVIYHLQFGAMAQLPLEQATPFFRRGYLWVDLFFVLSGFIIAYTARPDGADGYRLAGTRDFFLSRLARLYPLHLACLAGLVLLRIATSEIVRLHRGVAGSDYWSGESLAVLGQQVLLLNAFDLGLPIGWNIPTWSISAEFIAYACFPVLMTGLLRWPTATAGALLAGSLAFYAWVGLRLSSLDIVAGLAPLRCLAGFSIGLLIFRYRSAWTHLPTPVLLAAQALSLGVAIWVISTGLNDIAVIPAFALLVASTWPDRGLVARLFGTKPLQFLGRISFSLYLTHIAAIEGLGFVFSRVAPHLPLSPDAVRVIWLALALGGTIILSTITFHRIEGPAREAVLRRLLHRRPAVDIGVPTAP